MKKGCLTLAFIRRYYKEKFDLDEREVDALVDLVTKENHNLNQWKGYYKDSIIDWIEDLLKKIVQNK